MFLSIRRLSSAPAVSKKVLQSLRSETGLPFIKIKEALQVTNNNAEEAKEWLLAQAAQHNWTKAEKLKERTTSQGLVGIFTTPERISMVSLLCETDFVCRNSKFLNLLHHSLEIVSEHGVSSVDQALTLPISTDREPLGEAIISTVGSLGENIKLSGVYSTPATPGTGTYLHRRVESDIAGLQLGTIGVVVSCDVMPADPRPVNQISQHIAGSSNLSDQPLLQDETVTVGQLCNTHGFRVLDFCKLSVG
eukprot:sb/3468781/